MKAGTKGILIGLAVVAAAGGVYWYIRSRDPRNAVARKMGMKKSVKDKETGNIIVPLAKSHKAQFYDNGRFFVFNEKEQWLYKGNYENGGSVLIITDRASVAKEQKAKKLENKDAYKNIVKLSE